ncbi:MAG: YezD family protein [Clostridiales bacterium]|nr:YezD family protein [Clostridiales bacterium]
MTNDKTIISKEHLETIAKYLEEIRYGSVTIVVQDGKIVQIEKQEKIRFR